MDYMYRNYDCLDPKKITPLSYFARENLYAATRIF